MTAQFTELAQLLYEQAALAEGSPLANPPEYVQRLNRLLVRLAAPRRAALACEPPPAPSASHRRSRRGVSQALIETPPADSGRAARRCAPSAWSVIRTRSTAARSTTRSCTRWRAPSSSCGAPAIRFNFRGVGRERRQLRRGARRDRGRARGDRATDGSAGRRRRCGSRASPSAARWRCSAAAQGAARAAWSRWRRASRASGRSGRSAAAVSVAHRAG